MNKKLDTLGIQENEGMRAEEYVCWVEKGWWSSQEAICVFLGHSPDSAKNQSLYGQIISSKEGQHLKDLVGRAEVDGSVEGIHCERVFLIYRASCKAWVNWALTKPSIDLDPQILHVLGIAVDQLSRDKDSYRPKEEIINRSGFIAIAKSTLYLCPKARLEDITQLIEKAGAIGMLPGDRTLRKWLKQEGLSLFGHKQAEEEIAEIEEKLSPLLQPNEQITPLRVPS